MTCSCMRESMFVVAVLAGFTPVANGQGTEADYRRADQLRERWGVKLPGATLKPHWIDGHRFWYRADGKGGMRQFFLVDALKIGRKPAFDHDKLAAALAKGQGSDVRADHLPIDAIEVDGESIVFQSRGKNWRYDNANDVLTPSETAPQAENPQPPRRRRHRGPESHPPYVVIARDHNLHLRAKDGAEEFPLTTDGSEEMSYRGDVSWSPDGTKLVAMKVAKGEEHLVHFVESSPRDQVQPRLHSFSYYKPGDKLPVTKPHLFDVKNRKEIPVDDSLFPNPWESDEPRWDEDSSRFTFLYNQRGHQILRVLAVDATSGAVSTIIEEKSPTFIDYAGKSFRHYLEKTGEFLWMSERDGWNHLYLIDAKTGAVKRQVTQGQWVVRGVDHVDEAKRVVWIRAGGIHGDQDPYHVHFLRVSLDGGEPVRLTMGDGTHEAEFSPDRSFFVDHYSRVDLAPTHELRRSEDGTLVMKLGHADISALESEGWKPPERFVAKGRDGVTDIFGIIHRPSHLDPKRSYPVIEMIYAGPHSSHVPKTFAAYRDVQGLCELGFIVVQIDGMGTSNRSKAFHDVCWKNLGDAGFPDRIPWIKAAAKKYPYLDLSRVGIYGGSAGGQNSLRALLAFGDFYKAAVADCGCHDNRMDKVWWNELWMGWPVGPHYAEQSNVTQAHRLTGRLLLIVGEMDRNVDPSSTMQVVDALIRADKDFELLVVPGAGHGIGGGRYGERRRRDFFVRHLLGVEPRSK